MGIWRKIAAVGTGLALFYLGTIYGAKKVSDAPYQIKKDNGVYLLLDKYSNEEFEAEKLIKVYHTAEDLVDIINGEKKSKHSSLSELERAFK